MTKTITLISVFVSLNIYAQTLTQSKHANEVGFEVLGLIDAQSMLTYERTLGNHFSVLIGGGIKNEDGLINLSGINSTNINTNGITYSGYKLLLEGRYYINRHRIGRLTGFYLGLYVKYSDFNSDIFGTFSNDEGESLMLDYDADIEVTSIGFLIGYKLPLGKRFAIDFLIAGPGSGHYNLGLQNNSEELPDSFYEELNEALEDYGIFDVIDGDFEFRRDRRKTNFTTLSFRYAIKLGFAF